MATLGPGVHLVRPVHYGTIIDAVPTAGTNVWLDLSCLPYGLDFSFRYPSSAASGRIVSLDCGPFGSVAGLGSRGVTVLHGQTVTIRRNSKNSFQVISPSNPTPRVGNNYFNVSPQRVLIVGQSLGQQWEYMPAAGAFVDANSAASTQFYHMCMGGSAALKEYAPTSAPLGRWWWDVDKHAPGPLLLDVINAMMALDANLKPTHVLWVQGEQESYWYAGTTTAEDDVLRERYKEAVFRILDAIRVHVCMADRYSVPAFIQRLGRRASGEPRGIGVIQQAQDELVVLDGVNIHMGAVPPSDLPLADDVHPTSAGYQILGDLTGAAFNAI